MPLLCAYWVSKALAEWFSHVQDAPAVAVAQKDLSIHSCPDNAKELSAKPEEQSGSGEAKSFEATVRFVSCCEDLCCLQAHALSSACLQAGRLAAG